MKKKDYKKDYDHLIALLREIFSLQKSGAKPKDPEIVALYKELKNIIGVE